MQKSECPAAGSMPEKSEDSTPQDFMYKSMVYLVCVCVYVDLKRDKRCKSVYIHKNIYGVFFVWRQNQPCQQ